MSKLHTTTIKLNAYGIDITVELDDGSTTNTMIEAFAGMLVTIGYQPESIADSCYEYGFNRKMEKDDE